MGAAAVDVEDDAALVGVADGDGGRRRSVLEAQLRRYAEQGRQPQVVGDRRDLALGSDEVPLRPRVAVQRELHPGSLMLGLIYRRLVARIFGVRA